MRCISSDTKQPKEFMDGEYRRLLGVAEERGYENPQAWAKAVAAARAGTPGVCAHCDSRYPLHDLDCPVAVAAKAAVPVGVTKAEGLSDRELLELAARAAGIDLDWNVTPRTNVKHLQPVDAKTGGTWQPLHDDGDALRLAKSLRMTIAHEPSRGGWSVGAVVKGEFKWLVYEDDVLRLCRAIVRAAAEIGRAMP